MRNGAVEQAAGAVHHHEAGDRGGSRGLAGDGDVAGFATEGGDVLAHPPQGGDLVEQPPVVGVGDRPVRRDVAEALETDSVVESHHDQSGTGQYGAVEVGLGRRAEGVGTAVDPDEHRQGAAVRSRRPQVDSEDVLVTGGPHGRPGQPRGLRGDRTEAPAVPHPGPGGRRSRLPEPVDAERRGGIRNTEDGDDVAGGPKPPDRTVPGLEHDHRDRLSLHACGAGPSMASPGRSGPTPRSSGLTLRCCQSLGAAGRRGPTRRPSGAVTCPPSYAPPERGGRPRPAPAGRWRRWPGAGVPRRRSPAPGPAVPGRSPGPEGRP